MAHNKCCCCIPLRAGVMIIAGLSTAAYLVLLIGLLIRREAFLSLPFAGAVPVFWVGVVVCLIYALSSIFGVVGAITNNRAMTNIFRVLYWIMAIISLIVSVAVYIFALVKRGDIEGECSTILQNPGTYGVSGTSTFTKAEADAACSGAMRTYLIASGIALAIGNIIQLYFASAIGAYSARLRRTNLHQKLHNVEDFPVEPVGKAHF
ncbi:hypothetical protein BC940DRAFT_104075 [Gongronella butleri]|nr:hypothetical protein BC940DRAFT_104075 [Gongronella butleri]